MVIEAAAVAGYFIAWAVRKVRRVGGRLDTEIDAAVDVGLNKLHAVVAAKLGAHPVLDELTEEVADDAGQVSELTRQQVELAITAAARKDDDFGRTVTGLVTEVRTAEQACGVSVIAGANSTVFTGNAYAHASGPGIAFGQVGGDVHVGHGGPSRAGQESSVQDDPNVDPSPPGRSSR